MATKFFTSKHIKDLETLGYKILRQKKLRKSILYRRLYRFGHQYDIFRIPINTGVPFLVYPYFIYLIYVYINTHTQTHPHRQINTEIHKHTQCFCNWAKFCHILFNNTKIIYKKIIITHTVLKWVCSYLNASL